MYFQRTEGIKQQCYFKIIIKKGETFLIFIVSISM